MVAGPLRNGVRSHLGCSPPGSPLRPKHSLQRSRAINAAPPSLPTGLRRLLQGSASPSRRGRQQVLQFLLPELRVARGAVAARILTRGNKEQTGVADTLECAFSDAGLRRIALIVGGVDRENGGLDALEARRRIIVARRVVLVDEV